MSGWCEGRREAEARLIRSLTFARRGPGGTVLSGPLLAERPQQWKDWSSMQGGGNGAPQVHPG